MSRSRLDIVVETIAGLAVSTDIFDLLMNVRPTQKCFLGVLERVQANRAQGDEGCSIDIACVTTAHRVFLLCMENLVCKKPTVWGFVIPGGGLKLFLGFPPPFVLDTPGRVGNLLAADLHRSIGLSAAPPSLWPGRELRKYHCLEVPGGCLFNFQGSLHSFGLVLNLGRGPCCGYSVPEN